MKLFLFVGKLLLFWLTFFLLQQILFFYFNSDSFHGTNLDFFKSLLIGLRMNLAGILFIISIPIIFLLVSIWGLNKKITDAIIKWETIILLIFCSILCAADIGIYKAWGTKFNAKALSYLAFPKDVLPLVFDSATLFLFPLLILEIILFLWLRRKIVGNLVVVETKWPIKIVAFSFVLKK